MVAVAVGIPLALTGKGGAVGVMGGMRGTPGVAWSMAIAVAALSAAGYTLTARAERRTTPVVTACYNTLQPVIALTIMIALGESPGIRNLLGSALIMIGGFAAVALSTNDKKRWKQSYPPGDVGVDRNFKPDDAKLATGKSAGFGDDGSNADDGFERHGSNEEDARRARVRSGHPHGYGSHDEASRVPRGRGQAPGQGWQRGVDGGVGVGDVSLRPSRGWVSDVVPSLPPLEVLPRLKIKIHSVAICAVRSHLPRLPNLRGLAELSRLAPKVALGLALVPAAPRLVRQLVEPVDGPSYQRQHVSQQLVRSLRHLFTVLKVIHPLGAVRGGNSGLNLAGCRTCLVST